MGLRPHGRAPEVEDWPDDQRERQLARKRTLLQYAHDDVVAVEAGVEEAVGEAAALMSRAAGRPLDGDRPPLEAAALLVPEDLCLLVRRRDGWRLVAGVVCFPSMWRIGDKLGRAVTDVHGPVPAYADELAARVDLVLDRLGPDRPVWRRNWFVHDTPELHLPAPPPPHPAPVVPDDLWLRSERQILRRLPASGSILFTIRTALAPLAVVAGRPDVAAGLKQAIGSWSSELVDYRGAARWRDGALAWLGLVSGEGATALR
jgi:hypothetical protein